MPSAHTMTVREVSALLDLDEKAIRKDLEYGVLEKRSPVEVSFAEAVYLLTAARLAARLGDFLGVQARRSVRLAVEESLTSTPRISRVELTPGLELHVGRFADELEERVVSFDKWKRERIVENSQTLAGEPTFKGTRLSVRKIGDMINRHGEKAVAEIREDYPYVTDEDIGFAPRYARAYPRRGRPPLETAP